MMHSKHNARACGTERRDGDNDSSLRPDIITLSDQQTFDVVISIDKNAAFHRKIAKYDKTSFKKVIPIAMDYYFQLHPQSYRSLTKYLNGNVLM